MTLLLNDEPLINPVECPIVVDRFRRGVYLSRTRSAWGATNVETRVMGNPSQNAARRLKPRSPFRT